MKTFECQKPYRLDAILAKIAFDGFSADNACLYTETYQTVATADTLCYLDSYPTVNDEDEEEYPDFIVHNKFQLFAYGQQVEDVVHSALSQKKKPSSAELIKALNHYFDTDAFLTL